MQSVLGAFITGEADKLQRELSSAEIFALFEKRWLHKTYPLELVDFTEKKADDQRLACCAKIRWKGELLTAEAKGNGPLDAFASALAHTSVPRFNVKSFHEHALGTGSGTDAIAFVELNFSDGTNCWGCGKSSHIGHAGLYALVSAVNQLEGL